MAKYTSKELTEAIVSAVQEIKGEDIEVLDLQDIENRFCDQFILCNGSSSTHVGAIADSVERMVRKSLKVKPLHVEKTNSLDWVLLDYIDVIVHVFQPQTREYYNLEEFWKNIKTASA